MRFEWDEAKNRSNLKKHGIEFETAVLVFEDLYQLSFQDRIVEGEDRWQTFGVVASTILMVAHTWRAEGEEEIIRVISARRADPHEKRIYEAHKAST
jgi:uncharacterized DUF497 family protein